MYRGEHQEVKAHAEAVRCVEYSSEHGQLAQRSPHATHPEQELSSREAGIRQ
jgi:hypothetical protein